MARAVPPARMGPGNRPRVLHPPGLIPCHRAGDAKGRRPLSQGHGLRLSEFNSIPGVSRPCHGWLPW